MFTFRGKKYKLNFRGRCQLVAMIMLIFSTAVVYGYGIPPMDDHPTACTDEVLIAEELEPIPEEEIDEEIAEEVTTEEATSNAVVNDTRTFNVSEEARKLCAEYNLDYAIFMGLMDTESSFNPNAVSSTSDYGICQINSINHKWLMNTLGLTDIMDPAQNMRASAYLLAHYRDTYCEGEPIHVLLVTYNMGPSGAKKLFNEGIYSSDYSRSVIADSEKYNNSDDVIITY